MKIVLLVVFLAAAATAAVVSNEVPDVEYLPDVIDRDVVANVDVNEMPEVVVTDVNELADGADLTDVPEETGVASRRNLVLGSIGSGDVRVHNADQISAPISRDIRINANRRITAIRVTRLGASQNATPSVVSGGIGNNFVIIRLRSATGRGFHYNIQVYAR